VKMKLSAVLLLVVLPALLQAAPYFGDADVDTYRDTDLQLIRRRLYRLERLLSRASSDTPAGACAETEDKCLKDEYYKDMPATGWSDKTESCKKMKKAYTCAASGTCPDDATKKRWHGWVEGYEYNCPGYF